MTIKYHYDIEQRSPEWYAARCGLLTASDMKHIITPSTLTLMKKKDPKEEIDHLWELLSQRVTKYIEPVYQSYDMLRGLDDELDGKRYYEENYAKVKDCGLITNDEWGFTLGYSPDGLVGDDGLIEVKSRKQKFQVQTIIDGKMPDEYRLQVQTGLLVSGRKWCDFISFCGGMKMLTIRVEPDVAVQRAIALAAAEFHERLWGRHTSFDDICSNGMVRLIQTERRPPESEITSS